MPLASLCSETLELRCLLSAAMSGGQEVAAEIDVGLTAVHQVRSHSHRFEKAVPDNLPDMTGTWDIVTHLDGFDLHAVLVLQQNGKKVTGTLQNDGQSAGSFKAKLTPAQPQGGPRATDSAANGKGKAENPAIASKKVNIGFAVAAGLIDGTFKSNDLGNRLFNGHKRE